MGITALIACGGLAVQVAQAQQPGIKRANLQRHDLNAPSYKVLPFARPL
jgi:hypothetical protein